MSRHRFRQSPRRAPGTGRARSVASPARLPYLSTKCLIAPPLPLKRSPPRKGHMWLLRANRGKDSSYTAKNANGARRQFGPRRLPEWFEWYHRGARSRTHTPRRH
eukprot:scaffold123380_cov30-Phaeocystis_antarctica.AAC.1